jgi:hypothetical protein
MQATISNRAGGDTRPQHERIQNMGNRAIVIFYDNDRISPSVYLHWCGGEVPGLLSELAEYMKGRYGDAEYAAARFTGLCHNMIDGNLSLGIYATKLRRADLDNVRVLTNLSHGDAGVVIVNTDDFTWKTYGGYLAERQRSTSPAAPLTLITPSDQTDAAEEA